MLYQTKNPHGGDIYEEEIILDYSANTNPFGTPRGVIDAMRDVLDDVHHYPDPYCRELVQAIASFENVPEEYILCGNGAAELIYAYCEAIGAELALELAPTFSEYSLALERTGCGVERYFLPEENDFEVDDGLREFIEKGGYDAVFLCNPNNPTGKLMPTHISERILDYCSRNNVRLFVDECFLDLSDDGVSMKEFLRDHPCLFILRAFTKSYGMAGVRLGYCMCSDAKLLGKMSATTQPWNVSLLAQAAGVAALREQQFLTRTKILIAEERIRLKDALEALGFRVCPSKTNFLLFYGRSGLHTELKKYKIAIRNCDNYHGLGEGWYRIAVRLREQNEQLIAALRELCGKE